MRLLRPDKKTWENILTDHLPEIQINDLEELHGGLSGAHVYRIKAQTCLPALDSLIELPSFVVKTSDEKAFDEEIKNWEKIPEIVKPYFGQINKKFLYPRTKEEAIYYLVMPDLSGFDPLHKAVHVNPLELTRLKGIFDQVYSILKDKFYVVDGQKTNSHGIVKALYLSKLSESLKSVTQRWTDLKDEDVATVRSMIDTLYKNKIPEPPSLTPMHGDLHAGNVLIKTGDELNSDIKLIDIDKFTTEGDYIYDLGELASHISFIGFVHEIDSPFLNETNYSEFHSREKNRLRTVEQIIEAKTREIIKAQGEDPNKAEIRYQLAKARFQLTCSHHENKENKAEIYFNRAKETLTKCVSMV